jgi:hypothetical protein
MVTREQIEEALSDPVFSHARRGDGCWRNVVWIYRRDPDSPSGVVLVLGADAAVAEPLLRSLRRTSPISPVELR